MPLIPCLLQFHPYKLACGHPGLLPTSTKEGVGMEPDLRAVSDLRVRGAGWILARRLSTLLLALSRHVQCESLDL